MDKLRAIKLFCRVVEARSFAAAARDLDVVPSVLSKAIAALEADLGIRLFNRTTRRVAVTEAGARYYAQCKQLVTLLEQADGIARAGSSEPVGLVRAGMHPAVASLLIDNIGSFFDRYRDIRIERTITNRPSDMIEHGLDVMVVAGDLADSSLTTQTLGVTEVYVCAAPAYLAVFGIPRSPADLAGHRVVIPGRRDETSFAHWSFQRVNETIDVIVPAAFIDREGTHLTRAAVAGAGLIRVFDVSARGYLADGSLVRVLGDWTCAPVSIHALLPGRHNVPAKVKVFVNFVRQLVRSRKSRSN